MLGPNNSLSLPPQRPCGSLAVATPRTPPTFLSRLSQKEAISSATLALATWQGDVAVTWQGKADSWS